VGGLGVGFDRLGEADGATLGFAVGLGGAMLEDEGLGAWVGRAWTDGVVQAAAVASVVTARMARPVRLRTDERFTMVLLR